MKTANKKVVKATSIRKKFADKSFRELTRIYQTSDPTEIQMKILWQNLQLLIELTARGQRENLKMYDAHWQVCEMINDKKRLNKPGASSYHLTGLS